MATGIVTACPVAASFSVGSIEDAQTFYTASPPLWHFIKNEKKRPRYS